MLESELDLEAEAAAAAAGRVAGGGLGGGKGSAPRALAFQIPHAWLMRVGGFGRGGKKR